MRDHLESFTARWRAAARGIERTPGRHATMEVGTPGRRPLALTSFDFPLTGVSPRRTCILRDCV